MSPEAKVSVKLVASAGIGTIAAGVAKAGRVRPAGARSVLTRGAEGMDIHVTGRRGRRGIGMYWNVLDELERLGARPIYRDQTYRDLVYQP